MNKFILKFIGLLALGSLVTLFTGCAGLSHQYRVSTEGMSLNYIILKERIIKPKTSIYVMSIDERIDKDLIGDGAKPTVGKKFLGYLAFGVFYAAAPDQPFFQDQEDPITVFKTAMVERLLKNGVDISDKKGDNVVVLELLVRQFKLDFNFGNWIGEAGYVAKIKSVDEVYCQKTVYEKSKVHNWYGYGSGEKALNEVFNKAINGLDINSCFSLIK